MDETDDVELIHLLWRTMSYMHRVRDDVMVLKSLVLKGEQRPRPISMCTSYLREECRLEDVWGQVRKKVMEKYGNGKDSGFYSGFE